MKNNITTNEIKNKMNKYLEQLEHSSDNYFCGNVDIIANNGLYDFIIDYLSDDIEISTVEEYIDKTCDYCDYKYVDMFKSDNIGNRNATFLSLALNDIELLKLLHKKLNIDLNLKREDYINYNTIDTCDIVGIKNFINTEFYKKLAEIDECLKFSILHEAVLFDANLEILEYLLKNNAKDVNLLDENEDEIENTTALDLAKELKRKATIELLEKFKNN